MFADDTLIYKLSVVADYTCANINAHLHYLTKYFEKWKIKINVSKTQAIVFRRPAGRKRVPYINIQIQRNRIPVTTCLKYLGITFTNLYKFSNYIKNVKQKCIAAIKQLNVIMNWNSKTSRDIKIDPCV